MRKNLLLENLIKTVVVPILRTTRLKLLKWLLRRTNDWSGDGRRYPRDVIDRVLLEYPEYAGIDTLIETGTLKGDVACHESTRFSEIYTIEIQEELYKKAKERLNDKKNIFCYHGDSSIVIKDILKRVKKRAVFFLDAHFSGDAFTDWGPSSWKGYGFDTGYKGGHNDIPSSEQQVPLMQELDAIMKLHPYESILIIDDWLSIGTKDRGFKGEDWTHFHLDTLFEIVCRNRIKNVFSIGSMFKRKAPDMLVILLKEIA